VGSGSAPVLASYEAGSVDRSMSSISRFSSPESDIPCRRATAAKRAFVSLLTHVMRCLPSFITTGNVAKSGR
jgi:hypothetical protein